MACIFLAQEKMKNKIARLDVEESYEYTYLRSWTFCSSFVNKVSQEAGGGMRALECRCVSTATK